MVVEYGKYLYDKARESTIVPPGADGQQDTWLRLLYKRLFLTSKALTCATPGPIGYDLSTPISFALYPGQHWSIFIDIALVIPEKHYERAQNPGWPN